MELIKNKFEKYKIPEKKTITNERQLLIKDFLDKLNSEREPPYKPLSPARVGMLLRYCTNQQLKQFYSDCNYAKHFSKYFWYKLKN